MLDEKNMKPRIIAILVVSILSFFQIQCNSVRHIDIRCRPLTDYKRLVAMDYRTLDDAVLDSIQYREYLLSFSDTANNSTISGVFYVEKCYRFDKGLVLIAEKDSNKYEVIVISDNTQRIISKRHYVMSIKPYFNLKEHTYASEVRKEIYHKHYVIFPAYILLDEGRICTAELDDIVEWKDKKK